MDWANRRNTQTSDSRAGKLADIILDLVNITVVNKQHLVKM